MDLYSSHLPVLCRCFAETTGNVLELGTGFYSTPILHQLCIAQKRLLVSTDSDANWLKNFQNLITEKHLFYMVYNWADERLYDNNYGMVFVDQYPDEARMISLEKTVNIPIVVLHDTESKFYTEKKQVLSQLYRFRYDYSLTSPHTSVLSNSIDVTQWQWL